MGGTELKRKLLLATLSLLLPLTVFAAGADWDSYIKDPNYTVIADIRFNIPGRNRGR